MYHERQLRGFVVDYVTNTFPQWYLSKLPPPHRTRVMNGRTKESSGSDLTSLDSDGIELEDLEASHLDELRTTQYELDEDIGRDEDGLLGSNGSLDGIDLAKEYTQIFSRWGQVRSIVVEVGACFSDQGSLLINEAECPDLAFNHRRCFTYRRTVEPRVGEC